MLAFDVWESLLLDDKDGIAVENGLDHDEVSEFGKQAWDKFAYISSKENEWKKLEIQYWEEFTERFNLPKKRKLKYFIRKTSHFIKPIKGMPKLLKSLKSKHVQLAICTNNTAFWLHRQKKTLKLNKFFSDDKIISSCDVGFPKLNSNYKMFDAVINVLEIDKSLCLFVDDRKENVEKLLNSG